MADGSSTAVDVYVSLGSNIAPEKHLRMACSELSGSYGELKLSSVYESAALGFEGDNFLNMVVGFATNEEAERIVARMERLHDKAGRVRLENPFSSRTLDLDLLLYGDAVRRRPKLPREDIEKYGFVLGPLAEVAPDLCHPLSGATMQEMWDGFDQDEHPMTKVDIGLN